MASTISITDFGAKGDGRTDNHAAIQRAFDQAKATGATVTIPEGVFLHRGILRMEGIDVTGVGAKSVLKAVGASSSFDDQAIRITGDGAALTNLTLDSDASMRGFTGDSAKIWVQGAKNFVIDNVAILNSMGAGMLIGAGATGGKVTNNTVTSTNADSIHFYQGATDMLVQGNRVAESGDDGIAVVGYAKNSVQTGNITIVDNTVLNNNWGRNITVVGGRDVVIRDNYIDGNKAGLAGIYIASEPAYDTWGVRNVVVEDNIVKNTGSYDTGHGSVMIWGGTSRAVEDITVRRNEIVDAGKNGIVVSGSRVDDVTLDRNLIERADSTPIVLINNPSDVAQTGNVTSRSGWTPVTASTTGDGADGSPTPAEPLPPPPAETVITVRANGDSYKGDPLFRLLVDGKAVGDPVAVTVEPGEGWQELRFAVTLDGAPKTLGLEFTNNLYEGSAAEDRNIYIDGIQVNGQDLPDGEHSLWVTGVKTLDVTDQAALFASPAPAPAPTPPQAPAPAPDPITVKVYAAGNSFEGDPGFRLLLDGVQVGADSFVSTRRGTGWQEFDFDLPAGTDPDTIGVFYFNDRYGGPGKDRNLEIDRIEVEGRVLDAPDGGELFANGVLTWDWPL